MFGKNKEAERNDEILANAERSNALQEETNKLLVDIIRVFMQHNELQRNTNIELNNIAKQICQGGKNEHK